MAKQSNWGEINHLKGALSYDKEREAHEGETRTKKSSTWFGHIERAEASREIKAGISFISARVWARRIK